MVSLHVIWRHWSYSLLCWWHCSRIIESILHLFSVKQVCLFFCLSCASDDVLAAGIVSWLFVRVCVCVSCMHESVCARMLLVLVLDVFSPNLQHWCIWDKDEYIKFTGQRSRSLWGPTWSKMHFLALLAQSVKNQPTEFHWTAVVAVLRAKMNWLDFQGETQGHSKVTCEKFGTSDLLNAETVLCWGLPSDGSHWPAVFQERQNTRRRRRSPKWLQVSQSHLKSWSGSRSRPCQGQIFEWVIVAGRGVHTDVLALCWSWRLWRDLCVNVAVRRETTNFSRRKFKEPLLWFFRTGSASPCWQLVS